MDGYYMGVVGASFAATYVSGAAAVSLYEAKRAPPRQKRRSKYSRGPGGQRDAQVRGRLRIDRVQRNRAGAAPGVAAFGLAALVAIPLLGLLMAVSRDAKIERLRAMYKTGQITYTQLYVQRLGKLGQSD